MTTSGLESMSALLAGLRAAGEETRLRVLALLAEGELSVSDLTDILGQSQPRISRHLKLMAEAGLVERHREGAFAFFRLSEKGGEGIASVIAGRLDPADPVLAADRQRLSAVRSQRDHAAQGYFAHIAADWDRVRSLHAPDEAVEAAVLAALGEGPLGSVLDLGTGTGRMLSLIAPRASRAVGVDASHAMLQVARANLERVKPAQGRVELRQGDIYALPFERGAFNVVLIHQVLHYLDDPARALREAVAALSPGGRLIVVDFAPHALEFLREEHAHRRLGFSREQIEGWFAEAGLDCDLSQEIRAQEVAPGSPAGASTLTVMLWRGRDRRVEGDFPLRRPKLEVA
jgi:ArsR family transcriptional regulator